MSKPNQKPSKIKMVTIAMVVIALWASSGFQLTKQATAQNYLENTTGNQTNNLTGADLLPPRVLQEETEEEILEGQQ